MNNWKSPTFAALLILSIFHPAATFAQPKPVGAPKREPAPQFDVFSVALSPDGKTLAAGGGYWTHPGEIGVWDLTANKPLRRFAEDLGVASVAFSPSGKRLASASWTGHVRLRDWDAATEVATFEVAGVSRLAFSPKGDLLATATEQKTVQLWDVAKGKLAADLQGDLVRFHCVAFSPDGTKVLAGGGEWKRGGISHVAIWDVASKKQIMKLVGHNDSVIGIAFSPDAKTIATCSIDNTLRTWDAETGKPLKTFPGHRHWVECLAFTADGKTLVSGSHDHTIRFWDIDKGTEIGQPIAIPSSVRSINLTPDGKFLIAGCGDKTLKIFDAATHKETADLWSDAVGKKNAMDAQPIAEPRKAPLLEDDRPANPLARASMKLWIVVAIVGVLAVTVAIGLILGFRRRTLPPTNEPREAIKRSNADR